MVLPVLVFARVTIGIDPSVADAFLALESLVMAGFVISAAAIAVLEATQTEGVASPMDGGDSIGS